MTKALQPPIAACAENPPSPARKNAAVAHCCDVWESALQIGLKRGQHPTFAQEDAHKAFRNAMPALSGYQSICDFIACVAQAMLIGAIHETSGSKLLYAAQVALSSLRNHPKAQDTGNAV